MRNPTLLVSNYSGFLSSQVQVEKKENKIKYVKIVRSDSLVASKVDTLVLGQHHTLLISSSQGAVHAIGR